MQNLDISVYQDYSKPHGYISPSLLHLVILRKEHSTRKKKRVIEPTYRQASKETCPNPIIGFRKFSAAKMASTAFDLQAAIRESLTSRSSTANMTSTTYDREAAIRGILTLVDISTISPEK